MHARIVFTALIIASISPAFAGGAHAQFVDPQATYTSEWVGVWDVHEETRLCDGGPVTYSNAYTDTVCAGESFTLLGGYGRGQMCQGPGFVGGTLNLTCSGGSTCGCMGTCNVYLSKVANWTLNGNVATTVVTETYGYSGPPGCAPTSGACYRTTGTRTRVSSNAPTCAVTPTARHSWGQLKMLYR